MGKDKSGEKGGRRKQTDLERDGDVFTTVGNVGPLSREIFLELGILGENIVEFDSWRNEYTQECKKGQVEGNYSAVL